MNTRLFFVTLISGITYHTVYGQNCLTNGAFADACTTEINAAVPSERTWTDACGDGWVRSHGTPQMLPYSIVDGKQNLISAYMWASTNGGGFHGEGMFTPFTFHAHHAYDVRMVFSIYCSVPGTVNVYAANGLTQHAIDQFISGDPLPTPSDAVQIDTYTNSGVSFHDWPLKTFIPDHDLSQLWIYPTETTSTQFNLYVFLVDACASCDASIIYNNGTVPSGSIAAGYVYAGSSTGIGGTGTVTIAADQATTVSAVRAIYLEPSFDAAVTTGSFDASISPCNLATSIVVPDQYDSIGSTTLDTTGEDEQSVNRQLLNGTASNLNPSGVGIRGLTVYPTIGSGAVQIANIPTDLENAEILVNDAQGRNVFRSQNTGNANMLLDLHDLANGLYFLEIRSRQQVVTQKIVIKR